MYYTLVNPISSTTNNTYYYLKNRYGVDLVKVHIKNPYPQLIAIVFVHMRAMLLQIVLSFRKCIGCDDHYLFTKVQID
jgi:hypothetical protein